LESCEDLLSIDWPDRQELIPLIRALGRCAKSQLKTLKMGLVAAEVFCITLLLQLVVVTLCTLWPIKHDLVMLTRPHGWQQLYSIANSNLDVWVLSTLACLANMLCLASVASFKHKRETSQGAPPYKVTQIVIAVLALLTQVISSSCCQNNIAMLQRLQLDV